MASLSTDEIPDRSCPSAFEAARDRLTACFVEAGISLAVLHGSQAQGHGHAASDLGLGVLATDGNPLSYASMGRLASDLAKFLSVEVDVSDLATPDATFRYEGAKCARVLFESHPGSFRDCLGKTLVDYSDIERFIPELVAGVARRARQGEEASEAELGGKR